MISNRSKSDQIVNRYRGTRYPDTAEEQGMRFLFHNDRESFVQ